MSNHNIAIAVLKCAIEQGGSLHGIVNLTGSVQNPAPLFLNRQVLSDYAAEFSPTTAPILKALAQLLAIAFGSQLMWFRMKGASNRSKS